MLMGEEGEPQGVEGLRVATWVKPGRDWRPVPPITAMWMGSGVACQHWAVGMRMVELVTVVSVRYVRHLAGGVTAKDGRSAEAKKKLGWLFPGYFDER